ncbi:ribonuclease G [gamma proteobacterium HTCC5015]|nr:ribonuclease G [gamma proteobacterium HTCC5015]
MSEEILINVSPQETRVGVLENGVLQELYLERSHDRSVVNNIYMGRVERVMPGMEAAFIDIGLERAAFLHVADIVEAHVPAAEGREASRRKIGEVLREGQNILVQVVKEPLGTKGARLTTQITVASRYLVLMPKDKSIGVSAKIEEESERERLRDLMSGLFPEDSLDFGYIVRTVAEGASEEDFLKDARFLDRLWKAISQRIDQAGTGELVHQDLPLEKRVLRDMAGVSLDRIRIDSADYYERMVQFSRKYVPDVESLLECYKAERPIFDLYAVEDEIQRALNRKVMLKSGGYLIIDQTEAMTTIDVNTGSFVGHRNLEETTFRTNLEAAQTIARQLRLRNLGGIIILDFIDMVDPDHRRQVLRALERALDKDHARTHVCGVSELGLVEMTRKRTRESLEHVLCEPCAACEGSGSVKTAESVCYEIFREILRLSRTFDAQQQLLVLAHQSVVDLLTDELRDALAELSEEADVPIKFQVETLYHQGQYDVVML